MQGRSPAEKAPPGDSENWGVGSRATDISQGDPDWLCLCTQQECDALKEGCWGRSPGSWHSTSRPSWLKGNHHPPLATHIFLGIRGNVLFQPQGLGLLLVLPHELPDEPPRNDGERQRRGGRRGASVLFPNLFTSSCSVNRGQWKMPCLREEKTSPQPIEAPPPCKKGASETQMHCSGRRSAHAPGVLTELKMLAEQHCFVCTHTHTHTVCKF